jgi:DNA-binding FadR family transcriptional regulator
LSDIPVREAIRRLESEGYVHFTPHVGAIVTELDGGKIIELYLIRTELESLATRLAVPHVTSKDIDFLVKKNREMELAIQSYSPGGKPGQESKKLHDGSSEKIYQGVLCGLCRRRPRVNRTVWRALAA